MALVGGLVFSVVDGSPRTRGDGPCGASARRAASGVLPANAGMARSTAGPAGAAGRSPRTRGDGPAIGYTFPTLAKFSSHKRR